MDIVHSVIALELPGVMPWTLDWIAFIYQKMAVHLLFPVGGGDTGHTHLPWKAASIVLGAPAGQGPVWDSHPSHWPKVRMLLRVSSVAVVGGLVPQRALHQARQGPVCQQRMLQLYRTFSLP